MIRVISQSGSAEASYADASGLATHEAIKRLGNKMNAMGLEKDCIRQITVATTFNPKRETMECSLAALVDDGKPGPKQEERD